MRDLCFLAARMVRPGGTRQHFRSKRPQTALHGQPLGLDLAEVELIGTLSSNDDEIDPLW